MSVNLSFTHDNETRPVSCGLLVKRAAWLLRRLDQADKDVSIVLMGDRDMASYNSRYRQRPGPTNVLSFPAGPPPGQPAIALTEHEIGDILISVDTAAREAQNNNTTLHDRITELMIHGLLHLLGYDHERSEEEAWVMWDKEQELFRELKCYRSSTMAQLAINIDHVATVRQARGGAEPDPVLAAGICELAGARGIVVHLREDRRHIQDRDVRILRQTVKTKLNLEMAAVKEIILIALDLKPDMITLVPEKRRELTTEGGLDVIANENKVRKTIDKMSRAAIPVSLFIDPDMEQIKAAKDVGATFVELHTGRYCDAGTEQERDREFNLIAESAETAKGAGLRVNAGHGLDYRNTARIAALDAIEELSIGHAVISRAVQVGLDQAVREMLALVRPPFPAH
ncbi:MAG TPA: pyridoxine 5'-phosphate synthase [Desulfobacteraceae bacterium]|nr:pyridoxine 5'-phosphate synthase [Desulfobacteraceae bacterium]